MASLAEYFEKNRYQAKYQFGERVFGRWNKIPFIGTIGSDNVRSEIEGPILTITLDLPIKFDEKLHNVIIAKHKDVKKLTDYDTEVNNDRVSSKASSKEPVLDSNGRKRKSR